MQHTQTELKNNNPVFADLDFNFDNQDRVVTRLSSRSAGDTTLNAIVKKLMNGEHLTAQERHYYKHNALKA
jgi:hypothetical protein